MSEVVSRLSGAILDAMADDPVLGAAVETGVLPAYCRAYEGVARAALIALREPTEAMVEAQVSAPIPVEVPKGGDVPRLTVGDVGRIQWRAAIDAALDG